MERVTERHQRVGAGQEVNIGENPIESPQLEMTEVVSFDEEVMNNIDVAEELGDGEGDDEFECATNNQLDQGLIYELYQPQEEDYGFVCRICNHLGKELVFEDRQQYASHRYKVHGSFNNSVVCPIPTCKEAFASTIHLRRHLTQAHESPLEIHHQVFFNIGEFERWRHMVELASNTRFVMYTKQPNKKRQILHCQKSEHKLVLYSKRNRAPRGRMQKEGSCCPAVISFRVDDKTGKVHAFYQLYHVGHAAHPPDEHEFSNDMTPRLATLHFPESHTFIGERPMQNVQIDLIEMENAVYHTVIYSHILVMRDLFSGFIWAKPMPEWMSKQLIVRIITDKFCEYGIPDGYSCSATFPPRIIKDAISSISDVFQVQIREIQHEPPDYDAFRSTIVETAVTDLKSPMRWVEATQFAVMEMNQAGKRSAFERFFNRRPHSSQPLCYLSAEALTQEDSADDSFPPSVGPRYEPGAEVFLRNVDFRSGRGGLPVPYLFGVITAVDWERNPSFPYKVNFSKGMDPGPTESSPFVWAPPHYVIPSSNDLFQVKGEDREKIIESLMCSCRTGRAQHCPLFRSFLCSNGMAKSCCAMSGKKCPYHESISGDDSYAKMEKLTKMHALQAQEEEKERVTEEWRRLRSEKTAPRREPGPSMVEDFCVEVAAEEVVSETVTDSGVIKIRDFSPVDDATAAPMTKRRRTSSKNTVFRSEVPPIETFSDIHHPDEASTSQYHPADDSDLMPELTPATEILSKPLEETVEEVPALIQRQHQQQQRLVERQPKTIEEPQQESQTPNQPPTRRSQRTAKARVFTDFVTE